MRILIIGSSGEIGRLITPALKEKYEVITAGRNSGNQKVDIPSASSIEDLYKQTGKLDAVICAAGGIITVVQKLLAQINLVLIGLNYVNDNGSFTLISGVMGEKPKAGTSGKSIANGDVNSFVLSVALEMPRGIRINVVSPAKVSDIPAEDMIAGYLKSIETTANGKVIRIGYSI